jgi:hypothetical protein
LRVAADSTFLDVGQAVIVVVGFADIAVSVAFEV